MPRISVESRLQTLEALGWTEVATLARLGLQIKAAMAESGGAKKTKKKPGPKPGAKKAAQNQLAIDLTLDAGNGVG